MYCKIREKKYISETELSKQWVAFYKKGVLHKVYISWGVVLQ